MRWRTKEDRNAASQVLPDVLSRITIQGEAVSYPFEGYTIVRTALAVLATSLKTSEVVTDHIRDDFVSEAVRAVASSDGVPDVDAFLKAAARAEKTYLKRKPVEYVFLSRLSLQLPATQLRRMTWRGVEYRLTRREPRGFVRHEKAAAQEAEQSIDSAGYCWIRSRVEAREPLGAGDRALERLDEWRAVWNYSLTYGQTRLSFRSGHPAPVNPIVTGPVHTLHDPSGQPVAGTYWWEPSHLGSIQLRSLENDLTRVRRLARHYSTRVGASRAGPAIANLFVRYARALDERDMHSAFLKLWGILEVATGTTLQGYDVTVRRAAAVWRDRKKARAVLQHLRSRRNDLVHQGRESGSPQEVVYSLKSYVDELLGRLVGNAQQFSDLEEFGEYLDLLRNPEGLERRLHLVRLAVRAK